MIGPIETQGRWPPSAAVRARGGGRGQNDDVRVGKPRRAFLDGPIERDDIGGELIGENVPGSLGSGEEDVAGRPGNRTQQTVLGRLVGDDIRFDAVGDERCSGSRADDGDARELPLDPAPEELLDRPGARQHEPVVARERTLEDRRVARSG